MSIFNGFLSGLASGTQVKITQKNGQVIVGTVTANDGEDSIMLSVSKSVVMRYDAIDSISMLSQQGTLNSVQDTAFQQQSLKNIQPPKKQGIDVTKFPQVKLLSGKGGLDFDVSKEQFEEKTGELESSDRNIIQAACQNVLTEYEKYEREGMQAAVLNLSSLAESDGISNRKKVYIVAAMGSYLLEDFKRSSDYFYYGDDLRSAYLSAYEGAYRLDDDTGMYRKAAAFSALYILYGADDEHIEEAAACLKEACIKCRDISGIEFIFENTKDNKKMAYAFAALSSVCDKAKAEYYPDSVEDSVKSAKKKYTADEVSTVIIEMSKAKSQLKVGSGKNTAAVKNKVFDTEGKIVSLNGFNDVGQITGDSGTTYEFSFSDVSDETLMKNIRNITKKSMKTSDFKPIAVTFASDEIGSKMRAEKVRINTKSKNGTGSAPQAVEEPNKLFSAKKYDEALEGFKRILDSGKIEEGFCGTMKCYLTLFKTYPEKNDEYKKEVAELIEKYADKLNITVKSGDELIHGYIKLENWYGCIDTINKMEEKNVFKDDNQRYQYTKTKAWAYRKAGEIKQSINIYLELERFVDRKRLFSKKTDILDTCYVDIAEMYLELGDYQQAKYFIDTAGDNTRRAELKSKIDAVIKEQNKINIEDLTNPAPEPQEEENIITEENEPLAETEEETAEYSDEKAFDRLVLSDRDIINTALSFEPDKFYCTVTYLNAAAKICGNVDTDRKSDYSDMPLTDSVISAGRLFNAAYSVYGFEHESSAGELLFDYQNSCFSMPKYSLNLFASAVLREAFGNNAIQPFDIERLSAELQKHFDENEYIQSILTLTDEFKSFKEQTAYCIDVFADYNTKNDAVENIINDAKECEEYISQRIKAVESQGRVRRARELIFHDENSVLKQALDAVCANDTNKINKIKKTITETFMRNDSEFSVENTDIKKIDKFIDYRWDIARDMIIAEKRNVNRPYDNLKGGKRNNIVINLKRVIDCVCRWVNVSENAQITKEKYYIDSYESRREYIIDNLDKLIDMTDKALENGFDWGIDSINTAADELLSKMEGTYDKAEKRYMYIEFLKSGDILLDDNYIPDISSTFSDLPDFNIFARIKAHASAELPEWKYRVQQIFSENIHNHNFRTVNLIKEYAEYINDKEVYEHPSFEYFDDCIKSSRQRATHYYKDFKSEIELYESYGSISSLSGEKNIIKNNIDAWYSLSSSSCDFGFFSDLIEAYKRNISKNAESTANRLMQQLNDISDDPNYNFGIYSREKIKEYIEERNFSVAENILNCIRRGDIKSITDFSKEPLETFKNFMAEYEMLYHAVSDTKVSLQKSFITYYSTRNVEKAIQKACNVYGTNKEIKGGTALIQNWPIARPAGEERISKIISLLGFSDATVTVDEDKKYDVYNVKLKKQSGKVNYLHPIPAFGSLAAIEGIRVLVIYGRYNTDTLIDEFLAVNSIYSTRNTIVLLDSVISKEERRRFARKIKENKSLSKTFLLIDRVLFLYLAKHYQPKNIIRILMAAGMPFAYNQPFNPKPNVDIPAELFTGRREELERIESYDGVNLVYGGRQLGKSSLLKMAEYEIDRNKDNNRAIVISIKGRDYKESASCVSRELVINEILPKGSECDDWETLTMNIKMRLKDLSQPITYLLLMLDEADKFIESCKAVDYRPITLLKEMLSPNFKFVLAGLHNLAKFDHDFYANNSDFAHLESCVIYPFKRPEATELLTHALAYLGFVFSDEVINLILAKTNYFPGLIHLYGQKLIQAMTNDDYAGYSETETPYYEVTENHIKKVLSDPNFKDEIRDKLRMTLQVEENDNSPYYIIALILAYLYYNEEDKDESERRTGFTIDEVIEKAKNDGLNLILNYSDIQIKELFQEMWDLNILTAKDDVYMFSTEGFRELLGTKKEVQDALLKYFGG